MGKLIDCIKKVDDFLVIFYDDGSKQPLFKIPVKGQDGRNGKNAVGISSIIQSTPENFDMIFSNGYKKTIDLPQVKNAREVQLSSKDGWILWKYDDETKWNKLIQIPVMGNFSAPIRLRMSNMQDINLANITDGSFLTYSSDEQKWMIINEIPSPVLERTITPFGITGNVEIDTPLGSVNFAIGMIELTVTSNLVDENSIILCQIRTLDSSVISNPRIVLVDGGFKLVLSDVPETEIRVDFEIR